MPSTPHAAGTIAVVVTDLSKYYYNNISVLYCRGVSKGPPPYSQLFQWSRPLIPAVRSRLAAVRDRRCRRSSSSPSVLMVGKSRPNRQHARARARSRLFYVTLLVTSCRLPLLRRFLHNETAESRSHLCISFI